MQERTKIICLILFNLFTLLIWFGTEAFYGRSQEISLLDWIMLGITFVGYTVFGFVTKNVNYLLLYSIITSVITTIFLLSDMYFDPDYYPKILIYYENSVVFFTSFGFVFTAAITFFFIGIGMIISFILEKLLKK